MAVHKDYLGKGIGSQLMSSFHENVDVEKYAYLLIRVWKKNTPALNLYKKYGFTPSESITQEKEKVDRSGTFIMEKLYLYRKMNQD